MVEKFLNFLAESLCLRQGISDALSVSYICQALGAHILNQSLHRSHHHRHHRTHNLCPSELESNKG